MQQQVQLQDQQRRSSQPQEEDQQRRPSQLQQQVSVGLQMILASNNFIAYIVT
jgi:hypothetical protein